MLVVVSGGLHTWLAVIQGRCLAKYLPLPYSYMHVWAVDYRASSIIFLLRSGPG